jgi:superkiller protein 3
VPWSHPGFLYLQHDDAELANEAFIRAQTLDPDLATAWVGQAFVAQHHDDEQAARVLFEHAVGLSEGSAVSAPRNDAARIAPPCSPPYPQLEADYGFAACVFAQFSSASPPPPIHLHSPASALSSFVAFRPSDTSALHLSALFCERLGEQALAIERIERASALLEREYEEDEDVVTATKYAIAQSNLGRIRLDAGDAAGAIEALETALGLLDLGEGDAASEAVLPAANRARVRTAAHLGVALAHFARGAADASLDAFRAALADVEGSTADADGELRAQVGVQMARVLWSLGGDERQEEAKAQLLDW